MAVIKSRTDLKYFETAAQIAGEVCDLLMDAAQPGVSSLELEEKANRWLQLRQSSAPFKNFDGFNHAICLSLNDEIVNGPPSRERVLKPNDLVSIAIGSCYRGFYGKAARTAYLGQAPEEVQRLLTATEGTFEAIQIAAQTKSTWGEVLASIPSIAEAAQLSIIDGSGGCATGKQLHEEPMLHNNPHDKDLNIPLIPGFAFTLMPMLTLAPTGQWHLHEDGWTHVTDDGSLSAHMAETGIMTETGIRFLTRHLASTKE